MHEVASVLDTRGDRGSASTRVDQPLGDSRQPNADHDYAVAPARGGIGDRAGPCCRAIGHDPKDAVAAFADRRTRASSCSGDTERRSEMQVPRWDSTVGQR